MKGGLYLIMVGLFFAVLSFSCKDDNEKMVMHDVTMEIVYNNNTIDTVFYYALLNEKKIMEFAEEDVRFLVVNIYADSTKKVMMRKVLGDNIHSFEILSYYKSLANLTKIELP